MNARTVTIVAVSLVGLVGGVCLVAKLARHPGPEKHMPTPQSLSPESKDDDQLFLSEQHATSGRYAVLDDDGQSCWLYLTECDSERPVTDVWVYNRVPPPPPDRVRSFAPSPPPAAMGYASDSALIAAPLQSVWSLIWSDDGQAVAAVKDGQPIAFVLAGQKPGYSRQLLKDGPWGKVWSDNVYRRTFRQK